MSRPVDERTRQLQAPSTALVTKHAEDPVQDLANERKRASFSSQELCYFLNGGKEKVERRAQFAEVLSKTSWASKEQQYFHTREEEYVHNLRCSLGIWQKMTSEKLSMDDGLMMRTLADSPGGLELHIGMFMPTIMSQGDAEQQAKWIPPCLNLQIIGTYAQTELGHGTFVRGLETTATYDSASQEFILHSPTLTSTKWWPGGMGKTATHAVVMARLILGGKDHGPHAFIVQLRSLADHMPMPGITVGDIGPKFGFGGVDNGFMRMDHVRIPRANMMSRFSKVTPEGSYVPPPPANAKASYATMLFVRADIVRNSGGVLSKAATIAVRYAAVRRQTAPGPGQRELQVLDYQNVANTLIGLVGSAYACWFMGLEMQARYQRFEADRDKGVFSDLPELHALSSGLKATCTGTTADGIEAARRCCGGHGYSALSGLPRLFASYVQNVTWEGDNNVLYLQTARYLLKALAAGQSGKPVGGSAAYLGQLQQELRSSCSARGADCWGNPALALAALRHRAARLAVSGAATLQAASSGARAPLKFEGPAWNSSTVSQIAMAKAHTEMVLLQTFMDTLQQARDAGSLSPPVLAVLGRLCCLFGLGLVEAGSGDLLEARWMTGEQAAAARTQHRALLAALRPEAVGLVDAFGWEDYALNSALGRQDGDVYKALLDMATVSPLNRTQQGPAWESVLKPVLHRKPLPKL
uniref:Acyl-coenzyme A oxidase n=2 Tax=Tetradesmus obliquus TaxID=3088 RepID=A0A383WBN6_TETOB|eukprot:jgi/Sobl393_1/1387/SZX75028.1